MFNLNFVLGYTALMVSLLFFQRTIAAKYLRFLEPSNKNIFQDFYYNFRRSLVSVIKIVIVLIAIPLLLIIVLSEEDTLTIKSFIYVMGLSVALTLVITISFSIYRCFLFNESKSYPGILYLTLSIAYSITLVTYIINFIGNVKAP